MEDEAGVAQPVIIKSVEFGKLTPPPFPLVPSRGILTSGRPTLRDARRLTGETNDEMNYVFERVRTASMTRASSASGSGTIASANHATEALPSGASTASAAASAAP